MKSYVWIFDCLEEGRSAPQPPHYSRINSNLKKKKLPIKKWNQTVPINFKTIDLIWRLVNIPCPHHATSHKGPPLTTFKTWCCFRHFIFMKVKNGGGKEKSVALSLKYIDRAWGHTYLKKISDNSDKYNHIHAFRRYFLHCD